MPERTIRNCPVVSGHVVVPRDPAGERRNPQQDLARFVRVGVVEQPEVVDVDQRDGHPIVAADGFLHRPGEERHHGTMVQQPVADPRVAR
jgi:hypothetical protein